VRDRETRIEVEAGGDVVVSADEVGGDKVVGTSRVERKSKPVPPMSLVSGIAKLASNIAKAVAAVKGLVRL